MKSCQYYERSERVENCPFAYSCKEECKFKYKYDSSQVDFLSKEVKELRDEVLYEDSKYDSKIENLQSDLDNMESQYKSAIDLCKVLIEKRYASEEELIEQINFATDIQYTDQSDLIDILKESENAVKN